MFSKLSRMLGSAGICAITGTIAGSIVGMIFGLSLLAAPGHHVSLKDAAEVGLILGLLAWVVVLFILIAFGRYAPRAVLLPTIPTCFVTAILTTCLTDLLRATLCGMILGWIVGFLVGRGFCMFCRSWMQIQEGTHA